MAVSESTRAKVESFEKSFKSFYIDTDISFEYSRNDERDIYIYFKKFDAGQMFDLNELAQSIGNSSMLRSGDDLKAQYPMMESHVVFHIF